MEKCRALTLPEIKDIISLRSEFEGKNVGENLVLSRKNSIYALEITLFGVTIGEGDWFVSISSIEGTDDAPLVNYCVFNGETESLFDRAPLETRGIEGRLYFYDYGPSEKKTATPRDYFDRFFGGIGRKKADLGESFLNSSEKKLLEMESYLFLVFYPQHADCRSNFFFEEAKRFFEKDSPVSAAIDKCIEESFGLPGRINISRLKRELKKYAKDSFDREMVAALCNEAVEGLPAAYEEETAEVCEGICRTVTAVMQSEGYSGEYPCFAKGARYVNFARNSNHSSVNLRASFGIKGKVTRRFRDVFSGDYLHFPNFISAENFEDEKENLSVYVRGICAVLERKNVSKEFKKLIAPVISFRIESRAIGIICILLSLCLAGLIALKFASSDLDFVSAFSQDKANNIFELLSFVVVLILGVYMSVSHVGDRMLVRDKGEL